MSQPPLSQQFDLEMNDGDQVDEKEQYVNVDHGYGFGIEDEDREEGDMEGDVSEREDEYHDIYIGDVEAQVEQDGIDRDTFYRRCYASDSEDEGPEEVDEDGFTAREAQAFLKVVGRDH